MLASGLPVRNDDAHVNENALLAHQLRYTSGTGDTSVSRIAFIYIYNIVLFKVTGTW